MLGGNLKASPRGETEETLEEMKREMAQMYSQEGMGEAERGEKILEKAYLLQQRYLNGNPPPSTSDVKEGWPFLFSQRGLYTHFDFITNFPNQQNQPRG